MKIIKKLIPHCIALLIFGAISALFFAPQYQGKTLTQGDMIRAAGMGQDIKEHIAQYDEHPQWAGNMFGGMPSYLIDMNYDGRYVKEVSGLLYFIGQPAAFIFIAMSCFYLMLILFGVNPWLGVIGGIAYGLSTYFPIIIEAGHITKMMALAWIPGLIGGIYYAYRRSRLLGASLAGIFAAIEISTSHYQITYYFLFVILALVVNEFVRARNNGAIRGFMLTTGALLVAAVLAVGANFVQLYYVAQHTPETIRGTSELVDNSSEKASDGLDKSYATQWSYGKAESFNLFIPNFMGGGSHGGFSQDGAVAVELQKLGVDPTAASYMPSYWGSQPFTEGPVYIGAVVIFLALFAFLVLPATQKWWLLGVSALALLLSWGHNLMWFTDLFFDYLPLYNKFRVPSMILVVLEFTLPLLAILGLQQVVKGELSKEVLLKKLKIAAGSALLFAAFVALVLPTIISFSGANDAQTIASMFGLGDINSIADNYRPVIDNIVGAMESERAALMRSDALRTMFFVVIATLALWALIQSKVKPVYVYSVLALVVLIDLYNVDRRFVKIEDFHSTTASAIVTPKPENRQILQDTTDYRVVDMTVDPFTDAHTSYFHRTVGGYHAAKLGRYQDLIEHHLRYGNQAVYNMLNTKYYITAQGVQINPDALGSAWLVDSVAYVEGANQEIDDLSASWFDPSRVAIVDRSFASGLQGVTLEKDSTASIELTSYKVNHLSYRFESHTDALVVFSEIYYPKGWTLYIDGVESDYFRADYILRAALIPQGTHTIEWRFHAPNFAGAVAVTRLSSLILLLVPLVLAIVALIKKPKKNEDQ
ncbi:MAG: hypothetical protein R3Y19_00850 [Rikenellaceae bacterium]